MNESLLLNLNEEPIEDGQFRTRNQEGQRFRPNLVDRGNSLSVKVDIVGITHGKFSKTADRATLLIFELRFLATGGRRFKQAITSFQFEDAGGKTTRDPVVHAISPRDQLALDKTTRIRKIKTDANAGINIGIDPAGGEVGLEWEMEETKDRTYFTALTGEKRVMRRGWTGEANTVIWTMEENEDKADGIPTFLRTAVLLRRPEDVPFSFAVKVETDVDFAGTIKTLFGLERKDPIDPVDIDPAGLSGTNHATIGSLDPKLNDLAKMDLLDLAKVGSVMVATALTGETLITGHS